MDLPLDVDLLSPLGIVLLAAATVAVLLAVVSVRLWRRRRTHYEDIAFEQDDPESLYGPADSLADTEEPDDGETPASDATLPAEVEEDEENEGGEDPDVVAAPVDDPPPADVITAAPPAPMSDELPADEPVEVNDDVDAEEVVPGADVEETLEAAMALPGRDDDRAGWEPAPLQEPFTLAERAERILNHDVKGADRLLKEVRRDVKQRLAAAKRDIKQQEDRAKKVLELRRKIARVLEDKQQERDTIIAEAHAAAERAEQIASTLETDHSRLVEVEHEIRLLEERAAEIDEEVSAAHERERDARAKEQEAAEELREVRGRIDELVARKQELEAYLANPPAPDPTLAEEAAEVQQQRLADAHTHERTVTGDVERLTEEVNELTDDHQQDRSLDELGFLDHELDAEPAPQDVGIPQTGPLDEPAAPTEPVEYADPVWPAPTSVPPPAAAVGPAGTDHSDVAREPEPEPEPEPAPAEAWPEPAPSTDWRDYGIPEPLPKRRH